ncbi:MAG: hypothetical protein M3Z37_11155 [Candidatus Eremiobacteraeota bacterium]|nr:hypothetical protein [Candidatus Eremiobacteraeota bacterium]
MNRIEEYDVCDRCLMQGRLAELPSVAVADERETESEATTRSSWWNRSIPSGV